MGLGAPLLDPTDPGLYRVQRGRMGADSLMAPDVGVGGRYVITTGEAEKVNGGVAALANDWRRVFDPRSPSFATLVLGFVLFVILSRVNAGGSVSAGARVGVK
jgi:hypothetical protein